MIRVGNCSGFYGDRLSAMREMLSGGELDYLTGDYLAELTMLILGKDQLRDPSLGYARTFVTQVEECLGLALEKGVRIVANAGGLNPAGLAARLGEVATGLGLSPRIAWVEGDNLAPRAASLGFEGALTANAYLGAFGIASALREGADIVVTGRVTDASVVVGPAIASFGWTPESYDELAGAVVAGHIIECGTQATGGNFSGFLDLPRDTTPLGFPLAEIASDGSSVITKHAGTGGAVTIDTVTAQLLYEVQSTTYLNPDVSVDLSSIQLSDDGTDRVRVSGVRGGTRPERLKVCVNTLGGHRNQLELVFTGMDIDAKAAWVRAQLEAAWAAAGGAPAQVAWAWNRTSVPADAASEEEASRILRCTVLDPDATKVGKAFTAPLVELALASYPGFTMTSPPGKPSPYGVYRPGYVDRAEVEQVVVHADGRREVVPEDPCNAGLLPVYKGPAGEMSDLTPGYMGVASASTTRQPLGTVVHARSGDKGGDANVGLWVRQGPQREQRVAWLIDLITPERVVELLPEADGLEVEVYALPNLGCVNVLIHGLLGEGVAASTRFDPQAKGLGEFFRSRPVDIPEELI